MAEHNRCQEGSLPPRLLEIQVIVLFCIFYEVILSFASSYCFLLSSFLPWGTLELLFGNTTNIFLSCLGSVPRSHIDDEYANASEKDPKILLTTSRNPSAPLTQFVKVVQHLVYTFSLAYLIFFSTLFLFCSTVKHDFSCNLVAGTEVCLS